MLSQATGLQGNTERLERALLKMIRGGSPCGVSMLRLRPCSRVTAESQAAVSSCITQAVSVHTAQERIHTLEDPTDSTVQYSRAEPMPCFSADGSSVLLNLVICSFDQSGHSLSHSLTHPLTQSLNHSCISQVTRCKWLSWADPFPSGAGTTLTKPTCGRSVSAGDDIRGCVQMAAC